MTPQNKLLGRNKELEHNAEYTKEIIKCKNENIKKLNEECAWLRNEMISFQEREKKYKEKLSEMMEQLTFSQKSHQKTIKLHKETQKLHEETQNQLIACQDVLCEIVLLTPDERNKLHNLVKTTRINLDPFLA
jgi:predicted nuclease with TOPRIM domain